MADYIERQAAISALRKFGEVCKGSTEAATAVSVAISVLSRVPSPWTENREKRPPGDEEILLANEWKDVFIGYYIGDQCYDSEDCGTYGVTHWMPKPDAPEVDVL